MSGWPRLIPLAPLLGLCLAIGLGTAALAGDQPRESLITVVGQARRELTPDQAQVSLGARTQAPSAQAAADQNAAIMQKLLAAIKPLLQEGDQVQTQTYRVGPQREWDQTNRRWRELGFVAENRVRVTTGRTELLGRLLQTASQAGANQIDGPRWGLADPDQAQRQIQVMAFEDARRQAQALAQAAGMRLGPAREISAGTADHPRPLAPRAMAAENAAAAPPPLEPGRVEQNASVTVSFVLLGP